MGETPKKTIETPGEACENTKGNGRKLGKHGIEGITMIITGI